MPQCVNFLLRKFASCVNLRSMTDLRSYLDETGEKQSDFANRVQTSPATISRFCAGTLRPSLDMAHRIERATNGRVPTEIWLPPGSGQPAVEQQVPA
ncbi:helix-turn-helix transcriptional regulator [Novosphingobium sp.]|uniref:helix-turn-helix transcriptional regulator n=1 Tax=Novosphingobium sp. TaxID=1874826 RepID=UPI003FA53701